jgi:hypothetical protein
VVVCKQKIIKTSYISLALMVVLSFQNCGKSVFLIDSLSSGNKNSSEAIQIIDADCAAVYGCQAAAVSENQTSEGIVVAPSLPDAAQNPPDKNVGSFVPQDKFAYGRPSALLNTPALENAQSEKMKELYYNFVADSKDLCEASIKQTLGLESTCGIGAGCGAGCGQPNSSCLSANPDKWGACIQE